MEKEEFTYERTIKNNDSTFLLSYIGIPKKNNVDTLEVSSLLDKFMVNIYHGDSFETMRFLTTILKDFKQKHLFVDYDGKDGEYSLEYRDSKLHCVTVEGRNKKNPKINDFEITYAIGHDLLIERNDKNCDTIECFTNNDTFDRIKKAFNEVKQLFDVKPIELDYESKMLVQIYQLFYNENPDFSDINKTNIKMQTMLYILSEFGYSLSEYNYNHFSSYGSGTPMDLSLSCTVRKLFPLGVIKSVDNPIPFNKTAERVVSYVGSRIRDIINDKDDELEVLKKLSTIMHSSLYRVSPIGDIKKVKEDTNYTEEEIKDNLQLIKSIKENI